MSVIEHHLYGLQKWIQGHESTTEVEKTEFLMYTAVFAIVLPFLATFIGYFFYIGVFSAPTKTDEPKKVETSNKGETKKKN
eukprot:CFRG0010T1